MTSRLLFALPLLWSAGAALAQESPEDPWADYTQRADQGQAAAVADELAVILQDETRAAEHGQAWAQMGHALHEAKLPFAALVAWGQGLDAGQAPAIEDYPHALKSASDFGHEMWLGSRLASHLKPLGDEQAQAELSWQVSLSLYDREEWNDTLGMLAMIPPSSERKVDAAVLEAVVLAQQGRYGEAIPMLLAAEGRGITDGRDEAFTSLTALNLARTYYATGDYETAMASYNRVSRSDAHWPEAQFEKAWAQYAAEDYNGTLGTLHSHHTPFLEDFYFPEAELLRAQSLFMLCKFPSATEAIDGFQERYQPLLDEVTATQGSMTDAELLADVGAYLSGTPYKIPSTMLWRYNSDTRLKSTLSGLDAAQEELSKLNSPGLTAVVVPTLEAHVAQVQSTQGGRIRAHLSASRANLQDMLTGIELTRIDLLRLESKLYTQASMGVDITEMDRQTDYKRIRKSGKRVWAYQGEYWADELGWYRVIATPECPKALQRGEGP